MRRFVTFAATTVAAFLLSVSAAQAIPFVGSVGFAGDMDQIPSDLTLVGAQTLSFNNVTVDDVNGDYVGVIAVGATADFNDIDFNPGLAVGGNVAKYQSPLDPAYIWNVDLGGGQFAAFYIQEVVSANLFAVAGAEIFNFVGKGYGVLPGFDATPGLFVLTGQGTTGNENFTFSASSDVSPEYAPEPATVALLGLGLLAAGRVARRRR